MSVTASGRCALATVLAEVTVEADIPWPVGGLCGVVAHTAGIVCRAVFLRVKIRGGPVQPSVCMRYGYEVVTVVTGILVGVIQVSVVAVYTHLSFVGGEGFVFRRGLPVGVTASGRCSPAAVLAEVTIEADVSGRICGLRWVMAHTAGIVCRTVDQGVKIRGRPVQPSACVRYVNEVVTVVT